MSKKTMWIFFGLLAFALIWTFVLAPASVNLLRLVPRSEKPLLKQVILFSAVDGQMLDHGKPVSGLKIERSYSWNAEDDAPKPGDLVLHKDVVVTDQQGRFHFDEVKGDPQIEHDYGRPVVSIIQDIDWLKGNEQRVSMFYGWRDNYDSAQETGYPTIQLKCDIATEHQIEGRLSADLNCDLKKKVLKEEN